MEYCILKTIWLPGRLPRGLEVLDLLFSQMAISVENALIYNTLEQKVEERTAELNASRELFSTFMDYLPAPVFIKDEDGRTLYVNRRFVYEGRRRGRAHPGRFGLPRPGGFLDKMLRFQ